MLCLLALRITTHWPRYAVKSSAEIHIATPLTPTMSHAVRAACSLVNRSRAIPTISRRAPQHRTPFSPITITRCAASGSDIKLDKNTPDEVRPSHFLLYYVCLSSWRFRTVGPASHPFVSAEMEGAPERGGVLRVEDEGHRAPSYWQV